MLLLRTTKAFVIIALLLSIQSSLTADWRIDGKVSKDLPWSKADGDFGAQLGLTEDPNALFKSWDKPGPYFMHIETGAGKPPPPTNSFQLGIDNMGMVVEDKDPLGVYKVKAELIDKVSGKKMILEKSFTATEAQPKR